VIDIPDGLLVLIGAALISAAGWIARSMLTTVRKAAAVITANESLQGTIDALKQTNVTQAECIATLEGQVERLQRDLARERERNTELEVRIEELERIISLRATVRPETAT
jgi:peptidoglycan hydrolase CwlO-like protein